MTDQQEKDNPRQERFRKVPFSGVAILVLGFFTPFAVAQLDLAMATERPATVEIKPETPAYPASPSSPGEEQEEEKQFDQRILMALFHPVVEMFPAEKERQDLTFGNFFSYGWQAGFKEYEQGPDDAARHRLLRIQPATWEREIRLIDIYSFETNEEERARQDVAMELALPVSRRFLIEFEYSVNEIRSNGSSSFNSGDFRVAPKVMLYETHDNSLSSGLIIRTPTGSQSVGAHRTSLTPYLAWWTDLGQRVGVHTYFGTDLPLGGWGPDRPEAFVQYSIAPAKTVTSRDTPFFGRLTIFAEFNGTTQVGGIDPQTTVTALPGVRWLLFNDFWVATGYEFSLTGIDVSRLWFSVYRDF